MDKRNKRNKKGGTNLNIFTFGVQNVNPACFKLCIALASVEMDVPIIFHNVRLNDDAVSIICGNIVVALILK